MGWYRLNPPFKLGNRVGKEIGDRKGVEFTQPSCIPSMKHAVGLDKRGSSPLHGAVLCAVYIDVCVC